MKLTLLGVLAISAVAILAFLLIQSVQRGRGEDGPIRPKG